MATKRSLLKIIRQYCSECFGGPKVSENVWPIINPGDVGDCTGRDCGFYPYRFGKDPNPSASNVKKGQALFASLKRHQAKEADKKTTSVFMINQKKGAE